MQNNRSSFLQFLFFKPILKTGDKVGRQEEMAYYSFYSDFNLGGEIVEGCLHEADILEQM